MKFSFAIGPREKEEFIKQADAVKAGKKKMRVSVRHRLRGFVEIEFVNKEEEETEK